MVVRKPKSQTHASVDSPFRQPISSKQAATHLPQPDHTHNGDSDLAAGLREMTGYEEQFVERHKSQANTARLCNAVLARCLVPPGADQDLIDEALQQVRALAVAQRDRLLIHLRKMSLGEELHSSADCPHCGQPNEASFRVSDLPLDFETPPSSVECGLDNGQTAVLRLPTAGDQENLTDNPPETDSQRLTELLTRVLVRLGTRQGPFDEHEVRALPVRVRRRMEAAIVSATPELDLSMGMSCPHCGKEFSTPFDVEVFFLPS